MFNDYLANEEAKQHIQKRIREAETYRLHQRLRRDSKVVMVRWGMLALIAVMLVALCEWL